MFLKSNIKSSYRNSVSSPTTSSRVKLVVLHFKSLNCFFHVLLIVFFIFNHYFICCNAIIWRYFTLHFFLVSLQLGVFFGGALGVVVLLEDGAAAGSWLIEYTPGQEVPDLLSAQRTRSLSLHPIKEAGPVEDVLHRLAVEANDLIIILECAEANCTLSRNVQFLIAISILPRPSRQFLLLSYQIIIRAFQLTQSNCIIIWHPGIPYPWVNVSGGIHDFFMSTPIDSQNLILFVIIGTLELWKPCLDYATLEHRNHECNEAK